MNVFQGEYVYVKMVRTLHEDGGAEIVDTVHSLVVDTLRDSVEWQTEASRHGLACDDCWDWLMVMDLHDDDAVDAINAMATTNARNIKMPNFAQWMTIFPALDMFLDNWSINYFIAVVIKQSTPSNSALSQYACTLIGQMNVASGPSGTMLKEGECPLLYAEGLFIRAFGEAYFTKYFEWLLRNDPNLGRDGHGQTLWLYIERCYIMKRDFDNLENDDGQKTMPEFAAYLKAVECVPDLGEKHYADKSFFAGAPSYFLACMLPFQLARFNCCEIK